MKLSEVGFIIVFDNNNFDSALESYWGFSCYISLPDKNILFDTGSNGRVLLRNLEKMEIDVRDIDIVFLSHQHWDHIGGLDSITELNPNVEIVALNGFSQHLLEDLRQMVSSVIVLDRFTADVCDNVYSTGAIGEIGEQALIIDTEEGLVIVTGCGHFDMIELVNKAIRLTGKKVVAIIGGMHMLYKRELEINNVAKALKKMHIDFVSPTHCSGALAQDIFKYTFKEGYIQSGAGKIIVF